MSTRSRVGDTGLFFDEYGEWSVEYKSLNNLDEIIEAISREKLYLARRAENVNNYCVYAGVLDKGAGYLVPVVVFRGTEEECLRQSPPAPRWIIDYDGHMIYVYDYGRRQWLPTSEYISEDNRKRKVSTKDELLAEAEKEAKKAALAMEKMEEHKKKMEELLRQADMASNAKSQDNKE